MNTHNGSVALVTGGSRGIGRAICQELARRGHLVLVNYQNNQQAAEETVALIRKNEGEALLCKFDVSDQSQVETAFSGIMNTFGRLDVLVCNAGITRDRLLLKMSDREWNEVIWTNLMGTKNCIVAAYKLMMKQRFGRMIAITSVVGQTGNAGQANYAASKAGIEGFIKSVARELAKRNVTANCVSPGFIKTDMTAAISEDAQTKILGEIPAGRFGSSEDVASAVAFLASKDAGYITGQTIGVNGGMYM